MDHVVVDAVLRVGRERGRAVKAAEVGLVLTEQQGRRGAVRRGAREQFQGAEERVLDPGRRLPGLLHDRLGSAIIPGPGVAEPRGRQHVQGVGVRAGVGHGDEHQQIGGIGLRVVDLGDPVAVVVECPGVEKLIFHIELAAPGVLRPEFFIGKRQLRVMVTPAVPGMAGHGVEVPPILLDVLPVVALRAGQPEGALLQDRVAPVPQRQPQAQALLDVAEPGQAVLTPPERAWSCGR